jgi:hypothetical protein
MNGMGKMQIVRFNNGKYGLRKFSFLRMRYLYRWVNYAENWEVLNGEYFRNCLARTEEEFNLVSKNVEIIKEVYEG